MTVFETVLVARTPAASGSPTLTVVDRLVVDSLSYVEELNRPGSATLGCPIRALSSAVKGRLVDLASFPCEVWIYADSVLSWAGPIDTIGLDGQTATLNCSGLLSYLGHMGITADTTFSAVDQFTIGKSLVNTWQGLSYGHYGLDTSTVGTSGVTRNRTYLQKDLKGVDSALGDLATVSDGFDYWVDASSRKLTFAYPKRGTDLSASIVLDARVIDSANVAVSVAPGDLVSDIGSTSSAQDTAGNQVSLYSYRTNATLQAKFGRTWQGQSFSNITDQATLDGHGDAFLATRGAQLLQPGATVFSRVSAGTTPGSFHPGDTLGYAYDAGLGLQSGNFRVSKVTITSDTDGKQRTGVEFI